VQGIQWLDDADRATEFASIYRRAGWDDKTAADTADGLERITLDEFRVEIGAGQKRSRRG